MRSRPVFRYAVALASSAAALAFTLAVPPLLRGAPFMLLYVAVMMSSWYGGLGPGVVSIVVCLVGSARSILPYAAGAAGASEYWILLAGFLYVTTFIVVLNDARDRAHRAQSTERADRQRAERGEQQLRAIVDGAPDAVVIVDTEGRLVLANSQVEALLGYRPAELVGKSVDLLVPDGVRGVHASFRRAYVDDPRVRPMGAGLDLHARRKDGSEVPVEISLSPLDLQGTPSVIAAIRDVSDRKRLESERLQAHAELARVRDDLTSMVVHDLKNPVNGIAMMVKLALRKGDGLPDVHRRYLQQVDRSCREMMRLIQNLLEISKMEEGRMPVAAEPVVLADVVQEVVTEYQAMALETGKGLVVSVDAATPAAIADMALLRRVLANLLVNALRHSGGSEIHIEAGAEPGDTLALRVTDNGRGIGAEDQTRIFEKFGSIRRSPTSEPSTDTGLGLPFCRLAVERMGGAIHLASRDGGPTTFAITLRKHPSA